MIHVPLDLLKWLGLMWRLGPTIWAGYTSAVAVDKYLETRPFVAPAAASGEQGGGHGGSAGGPGRPAGPSPPARQGMVVVTSPRAQQYYAKPAPAAGGAGYAAPGVWPPAGHQFAYNPGAAYGPGPYSSPGSAGPYPAGPYAAGAAAGGPYMPGAGQPGPYAPQPAGWAQPDARQRADQQGQRGQQAFWAPGGAPQQQQAQRGPAQQNDASGSTVLWF
jgi:hypothetical protein